MKRLLRIRKSYRIFVLIILVSICIFAILFTHQKIKAKGTDDCLACHEDKDLSMDKNGKKISLFVNGNEYKKSMHGSFDCTDCHLKYNPEELPHSKISTEINCKSCHDNIKREEGNLHNNVKCFTCHGAHNVKPAKEFSKDQTNNCLNCHKNKNVQSYKSSIHSKKDVKCENCHDGGHKVKKFSKSEAITICGKCHTSNMKDVKNSVHMVAFNSGNNNVPNCIDCHGSHNVLTSKMSIESQSCLRCHLNEKLFPGDGRGSAKFIKQYKTSIHGSLTKDGNPVAGCSDCHGNHMVEKFDDPKSATLKAKSIDNCGKCHTTIVEHFKKSKHGQEYLKNNSKAPGCTDCHGEHNIQSILKSDEFSKINQVDLCLKCHQDQKLPHKNYKKEEVLISNYKDSYHYKALKDGKNAATCSDCHGSHEMNKVDDPSSKIHRNNIPKTCGQSGCHVKQLNEYKGSIHETALINKNSPDAPNCNTCHGNHQIAKRDDTNNRISNGKGLVQLCTDCHNSVELVKKYNLPTGRTDSYMNSFHGLAVRGGSKVAANCESCHGYHNIKPSTDTSSTISKKHLPETCGKCHPGANQTLFDSKIHITDTISDSPILFWLSRIYIFLIIAVIGGMALHNILDLVKKSKKNKTKDE